MTNITCWHCVFRTCNSDYIYKEKVIETSGKYYCGQCKRELKKPQKTMNKEDSIILYNYKIQKRLREAHHIHIAIHLVYTKPINYYAEVLKGGINGQEYHLRSYNTYEKALESGIKKGLEWIKK